MVEYRLRVCWSEVYEWTDGGEGNHISNNGGFTLGHFKSIDDAKAELNEFFGDEPDYEAYEGQNFLTCDRLEDIDGNRDNDGDYLSVYTVVLEKISMVSWEGEEYVLY